MKTELAFYIVASAIVIGLLVAMYNGYHTRKAMGCYQQLAKMTEQQSRDCDSKKSSLASTN